MCQESASTISPVDLNSCSSRCCSVRLVLHVEFLQKKRTRPEEEARAWRNLVFGDFIIVARRKKLEP